MKKFKVYHNGKKKELVINSIRLKLVDCVAVSAEFEGLEVKDRLLFYTLGSNENPFIRFNDQENSCFVDVRLNQDIIEWMWKELGEPKTGEFYTYTENYAANWLD